MKERCEDGQFKDKTVLFCWEHKNIPYIVARFGLTDHGITWGSDPDSGVGSSILQIVTESVPLVQSCAERPCSVLLVGIVTITVIESSI